MLRHPEQDLRCRPLTAGDQARHRQQRHETSIVAVGWSDPQREDLSADDGEDDGDRDGDGKRDAARHDVERAQLAAMLARVQLGRQRHNDLEELDRHHFGDVAEPPRQRVRRHGIERRECGNHEFRGFGLQPARRFNGEDRRAE